MACSLEMYHELAENVRGIVFLGTPHKGSKYANVFNNLLSLAPFAASRKHFISELDGSSLSLQDIHEQFCQICDGLTLVSFWEAKSTSVAGLSKFIVDKDTAILGLRNEIANPLDADHHTITKYTSRNDPNYTHVRNVISRVLGQPPRTTDRKQLQLQLFHRTSSRTVPALVTSADPAVVTTKKVRQLLGIDEAFEEELLSYQMRSAPGTGAWFLEGKAFQDWIDLSDPSAPPVFWLTGLPGTGKSTIASLVVECIQKVLGEESCQYHFFRHDDRGKRTFSYCLRSLVYQMAKFDPGLRSRIGNFCSDTGTNIASIKNGQLWEKLIENLVLTKDMEPRFWVLDGVDESDSSQTLLSSLNRLPSDIPIRVLLISRPMKSSRSLLTRPVLQESLDVHHTSDDIRYYVHEHLSQALPDDLELLETLSREVIAKAHGSFLWVRITIDGLQNSWHTKEDIQKTLTEMPTGMESLYVNMISGIKAQPERSRDIAFKVITWAACSYQPLTIRELEQALRPDFEDFTRLEESVAQICGHFVKVDGSALKLIHETAGTFLFGNREHPPLGMRKKDAHQYLALVCLRYLSDKKWRRIFGETHETRSPDRLSVYVEAHPLLLYAARHWAYHVSLAPPKSPELVMALGDFLENHCLTWMYAASLGREFNMVTRAAQHLKLYARAKPRVDEAPLTLKEVDTDFLRVWAGDLIRVVGKFSDAMARNPKSLFHHIPAFFPPASLVGQAYATRKKRNAFSVEGLQEEGWDDCISRIGVGGAQSITKIACTDKYILTVVPGTEQLMFWFAETCALVGSVTLPGEYVLMLALNMPRTKVATVSLKWIRVWDIASRRQIGCFPQDHDARPIAVTFDRDNCQVVVGYSDCLVRRFGLSEQKLLWEHRASTKGEDLDDLRVMEFGHDGTYVALAFRARPVYVHNIDPDQTRALPRRCVRWEDRRKAHNEVFNTAQSIKWLPDGDTVLMLYQDQCLVSWRIFDETQEEFHQVRANEMAVSDSGLLLLTAETNGSLSVWGLPHVSLIYKLNYHSVVWDLTFSPDGHRILDARGPLCNVWEPEVLVRSDEFDADEASSTTGSYLSSEIASFDISNSNNHVSALAHGAGEEYFCSGAEDGGVCIREMQTGKAIRKVYAHANGASVVSLAWSVSQKFMISADDSGRVIAKRLAVKEAGKWGVFPCLDYRLGCAVHQILFQGNSETVLVVSEGQVQAWNLKDKRCIVEVSFCSGAGRWISHPVDASLLLWLSSKQVLVVKWPTAQGSLLATVDTARERIRQQKTAEQATEPVVWADWPSTTQLLVYETGTTPSVGMKRPGSNLAALRLDALPLEEGVHELRRTEINVKGGVARVIGTTSDSLVYLDKEDCVCAWEASLQDEARIEKHFQLPKDWISQLHGQPTLLTEGNTLLCARNASVGIIRHGI